MRNMLFCLLLGLWLTACSSAPSTAPEVASGDPVNETFWQLEDDSELRVVLTPWPPKNSRTTLEAVASLGDWGGNLPIVETLEYRVVEQPSSSAPYQKMERSEQKTDLDGETFTEYSFVARDVPMASGKAVYVQLKPSGSKMREKLELTDWSVKVP